MEAVNTGLARRPRAHLPSRVGVHDGGGSAAREEPEALLTVPPEVQAL